MAVRSGQRQARPLGPPQLHWRPYWSAPELYSGQRCTEKSDVYSLGVLYRDVLHPLLNSCCLRSWPSDLDQLVTRMTATCAAHRPPLRDVISALDRLTSI